MSCRCWCRASLWIWPCSWWSICAWRSSAPVPSWRHAIEFLQVNRCFSFLFFLATVLMYFGVCVCVYTCFYYVLYACAAHDWWFGFSLSLYWLLFDYIFAGNFADNHENSACWVDCSEFDWWNCNDKAPQSTVGYETHLSMYLIYGDRFNKASRTRLVKYVCNRCKTERKNTLVALVTTRARENYTIRIRFM